MKLKSLRKKSKLTQKDVEEKLGLKPSTVSKWEHCKIKPKLFHLKRLAVLYKCNLEALLECDELTENQKQEE
mgnify:CR=1 FL=1